MKENKLKMIISAILLVTVVLSIFTVVDQRVTDDEKKFKQEYESLNGKSNPTTGKKYISLDIDTYNGIQYLNADEVIDILQNKTGVIYFGFPQCPWCRNMITVLLDTAKELKVDTIYYYNALEIRDEKVLEDGKIVTSKKGTKKYYKILELLGSKASIYEGLNDENVKRLYFPTVVFVRNGKVVDAHMSTVSSQNDPYQKLTKKQKEELKKIYRKGIREMNGVVCSSDTAC